MPGVSNSAWLLWRRFLRGLMLVPAHLDGSTRLLAGAGLADAFGAAAFTPHRRHHLLDQVWRWSALRFGLGLLPGHLIP